MIGGEFVELDAEDCCADAFPRREEPPRSTRRIEDSKIA
jgi:hypothetical protein